MGKKFWRKFRKIGRIVAIGALIAFATIGGLAVGVFGPGAAFLSGLSGLEALSLGLSLFGGGKKRKQPTAGGLTYGTGATAQGNAPDPNAAVGWVYGELLVTPRIVYYEPTGPTGFRAFFHAGDGPVQAVDDLRINSLPLASFTAKPGNTLTTETYLGTRTQPKGPILANYLGGIPFASGFSVNLAASEPVGDLTFTCRVQGVKVPTWDGVTLTYQFSRNPAWHALDLLVDPVRGAGLDLVLFDLDSFQTAAAAFDAVVPDEYAPELVNLAPGASVTGGNSPAEANNGIATMDFLAPGNVPRAWWVAATANQALPLAVLGTVDLGSVQRIGLVRFWPWTPDQRYYRSYRVESSVDNLTWFELRDTSAVPGAYSGEQVVPGNGIEARYIRFSGGGNTVDEKFALAEVEIYGAAPAARYRHDLHVETPRPVSDILADVLDCCRGRLVLTPTGIGLDWDHDSAPVVALGMADLAEGSFGVQQVGTDERFAKLSLTYWDRVLRQRATVRDDWDPALETKGSSVDYEVLGVTSGGQAARLARLALNQARAVRFQVSFSLVDLETELVPGDVFTLTHDLMGWVNKPFRVVGRTDDQHEGPELSALEHFPALYEDQATTWDPAQFGTTLKDPSVPPGQATIVSAVEQSVQLGDGTWAPSIRVDFTLPPDAQSADLQLAPNPTVLAPTDPALVFRSDGASSRSPYDIRSVAVGTWTVRVVAVNALGIRAPAATAPAVNVLVDGDLLGPGNVTGLAGTYQRGVLRAEWSPVGDLDLNTYKVRWVQAANAVAALAEWDEGLFPDTPGVRGTLFRDLRATSFEVSDLENTFGTAARGPLYVLVVAVDRSGNESGGVASVPDPGLQNPAVQFNTVTPTVAQAVNAHVVTVPTGTGTGADDVRAYELHRSLVPFVPSVSTFVARMEAPEDDQTVGRTVSFTVPGVIGTEYRYRVCVIDAASRAVGDQYDPFSTSQEVAATLTGVEGPDLSLFLREAASGRAFPWPEAMITAGTDVYIASRYYIGTKASAIFGGFRVYKLELATGAFSVFLPDRNGRTCLDLTTDGTWLYLLDDQPGGGLKRLTRYDLVTGSQDVSGGAWTAGGVDALFLGDPIALGWRSPATGTDQNFYGVAADGMVVDCTAAAVPSASVLIAAATLQTLIQPWTSLKYSGTPTPLCTDIHTDASQTRLFLTDWGGFLFEITTGAALVRVRQAPAPRAFKCQPIFQGGFPVYLAALESSDPAPPPDGTATEYLQSRLFSVAPTT